MNQTCMAIGLLGLVAASAAAEEAPPPPGEAQPNELPPGAPPYWAPRFVAPPWPTPAEIDALEWSGRHQKRVGAILIGSGSAIAIAGNALTIAGAWEGCDGHHHVDHHDCGDSALAIAGVTTTLVGIGAIVPGILTYVRGGSEIDRARRLRQSCWGSVRVSPTLERGGAGLTLAVSH
jgi:hypothetical protein